MSILAANRHQTTVRKIEDEDVRRILRMVDTAWRVFLRPSPYAFKMKQQRWPGLLAEDRVGLRGFMVIEPRPPHLAFLTAAGLRDTWHIKPYLDLLLPNVEEMARKLGLSKLAYVGHDPWLIDDLWGRGFRTNAWIITLERSTKPLPPPPPAPTSLWPVTANDLHAVEMVDLLTFDELWHGAIGDLADALAGDNSFVLADLEGRIVGYEWCELYGSQAHLSRLAVHPEYQGRGIGAQLLYRAVADALAQGASQISLNTQENNERSLALYRRFGFAVTDRRMPLLQKDLR